MKPFVIIPTYNEKDSVSKLIPLLFALNIENLHVLVVDDNSPDQTANAVKALQDSYPLDILERPGKLGLGSAYVAGFSFVLKQGATHIIQMDADFSHHPTDLPDLLAASKSADLVIGSRRITGGRVIGWGIIRKAMSAGAMWFSRFMLKLKAKDVTAGFRCFQRHVLDTIPYKQVKSNGYAFQEEMLYLVESQGFSVKEVPVTFVDRQEGKSKLSKKDIIEFFIVMFRLRFSKKI